MAASSQNDFAFLDEDLQHVLQELGLDETPVPKHLFQESITKFEDLVSSETVGLLRDGKTTLRRVHVDQLLNVIDWFNNKTKGQEEAVNVLLDFSYESYAAYLERKRCQRPEYDEQMKDIIVKTFIKNPDLQTEEKMKAAGIDASDLVPAKRVLSTMTSLLKSKCKFDYKPFVEDCIEAFANPGRNNTDFLVYGPTQSGKSGVKGVLRQVGLVLQCPVFIITKGCQESENLCIKLQVYAKNTELQNNIQTAFGGRRKFAKVGATLVLTDGGTLIAADTATQVNLIAEAIQRYREGDTSRRFILVVDECDALYRTEDGTQKVEQAFWTIMGMKPTLVYKISATLAPVLLYYKFSDDIPNVKMYQIEPGDDYIGVDEMKPPVKDGKELYLQRKDLSKSEGYEYTLPGSQGTDFIPFTNESVMHVYSGALRPNALLLDVTCHLVNPKNPGGIFEKAEKVQHVMLTEKNVGVAVIVIVGSGIFVKYPSRRAANLTKEDSSNTNDKPKMQYFEGTRVEKKRSDGSVMYGTVVSQRMDGRYRIEFGDERKKKELKSQKKAICCKRYQYMDEKTLEEKLVDEFVKFKNNDCTVGDLIHRFHESYGEKVPIFCFGFSKMQRGVSFRSAHRVPTHLIHAFGQGYSIDKTLQSLGRGTYVGKSQLHANGFDHVVILSSRCDLGASKSYQSFMIEIHKRLERGESLLEALDGAKELLPPHADFARITNRKLGEIKGLRILYNRDAFEEGEELHASEVEFKEQLWEDEAAQRMMYAWVNLDLRFEYEDVDIQEAYNDEFKGIVTLTLTKTRKMMRVLVSCNLIERVKKNDVAMFWCPNFNKLNQFVNPKYLDEYNREKLHGITKKRTKSSTAGASKKKKPLIDLCR